MEGMRHWGGIQGVPRGWRAAPAPGGSMDHAMLSAQEGGRGDRALPSACPPHRLQGAVGAQELKGGKFPSISSVPH